MRETEERMRNAVERALRLGKRLADLMHYDKLAKEVATRWKPLVPRLTELATKRVAIVEQCFLANYEIQREIDGLQREIDRRSGAPLPPTLLERMEPMLSGLTDEQTNALRFIAAPHDTAPTPAPDTSAHRDASLWLADFTETLDVLEREGALLAEIVQERAKRGFADEKLVREVEEQLAASLTALKSALVSTREYLASSRDAYEALRARRGELLATLATD